MIQKRPGLIILLLGLLTAIVPFSIDMYLPGFPAIAKTMGTTVTRVALSLSSFFIGIGIGQLLYGPLLDRFGRKKPLYAGLLLYCITSIGCAFAPSIEILIALRFVQAIGACSATIASTAMVRDFFPPEENARVFSFLILVLSVSPMLAPTAGSYIAAVFGWRAIFYSLTVLIVFITVGVILFLPESRKADKNYSLHPAFILKSFAAVLREPYFLIFSFTGGIAFACLFAYISSSPAVFMENYGLSQTQYGLLFAFLASGLIGASQANRILLKYFTSEQIIARSVLFQNLIGLIFLIICLLHLTSFWIIIIPLFLYLSMIGLTLPNATALAMKPFDQHAGSASALLGFVQMGLGSVTTITVGLLNIKTVLPMVASMLICSVLGLIFYFSGMWFYKNKTAVVA